MASSLYLSLCRTQFQQLSKRIASHKFLSLNHGYVSCGCTRHIGLSTSSLDAEKGKLNHDSKSQRHVSEIEDETEVAKLAVKEEETQIKNQTEKTDATLTSDYFRQSWLSHYNALTNERQKRPDKSSNTDIAFKERTTREDTSAKSKAGGTFGTLTSEIAGQTSQNMPDLRNPNERIDEAMPEDLDEKRDPRLNIPLSRYGRIGKKSFYYTRKISILGREGKIKEAIAVFEDWMMVRDRVMPSKRTFVSLIGILGRVGYTDKAFELYRQMKQLGLDPEDHVYTSLFNACANCPYPDSGLRKAENLLGEMRGKGIQPNLFTVKSAMKAMALCGDYPRAFAILDEASTRLRLDTECFDHLLMACISDKEAGFRRALQVWQKMSQYGIRPAINTVNMLIRCARDCDIGDPAKFASSLNLSADSHISPDIGLLMSSSNHNSRNETLGKADGSDSSGKSLALKADMCLTDRQQKVVAKDNKNVKHCTSEKLSSKPAETVQFHVKDIDNSMTHAPHDQELTTDLEILQRSLDESGSNDDVESEESHAQDFDKDVAIILSQSHMLRSVDGSKVYEWWEDEPEEKDLKPGEAFSDLSVCSGSTKSLYSIILTSNSNTALVNKVPSALALKDLKRPEGRLALLGGVQKLVAFMKDQGLQPELKTFAQLLACLPEDEYSELELLTVMEENGLKPDIDLLNDIMMRRNKRRKGDTVKAILPLISKLRLTPNMRTYAALALSCSKEHQAQDLLRDMKEANLEPNSVIIGHLIRASALNFTYKQHMLETMEAMGLKPDKENIATIEKSISKAKKRIIDAERNKDTNSFYLCKAFQKSFQSFLRFYQPWLLRTEMDQRRHPWDSFKSSDDQKHLEKDKRMNVN